MNKILVALVVFFISLLSVRVNAQSEITVTEVVYINDEFDRVLNCLGKSSVRLNINLGQIYYHLLYIKILTDDLSLLDNDNTPFFLLFKNSKDTIPFIICDETIQKSNNVFFVWLVAAFSDEVLPYEKEIIIEDIRLASNQIISILKDSISLLYFDKKINEYKTLEYNTFKAPYYKKDKLKYKKLCPYPTSFDERWLIKTRILDNDSTSSQGNIFVIDFDDDILEP